MPDPLTFLQRGFDIRLRLIAVLCCPPAYSYRSATIGSIRAARHAGYIPDTIPVPADNINPISAHTGEKK